MSKHTPIAPGPEEGRPRSPRGPSLVERAATVYDFKGAMRTPAPVPVEAPRMPVGFVPAQEPVQGDTAPAEPVWRAPAPEGRRGVIARDQLRRDGFVLPEAGATAIAEEFRIVKRQLLRNADTLTNGRTILVSSARPDDGKTFCTINLALSLAAEKDLDVVLVDADVAKPEILTTLGLEGGPGLLDALADPTVDVEACLIHTDIPGLAVLPAGRQSNEASELIASSRTRTVLDQLRSRVKGRVVLFDSPPALAASPASVLAMHCGQAIVVVRAERTSEGDLREALELLSACPKPQLLLNGAEFGGKNRRFGTFYGVDG